MSKLAKIVLIVKGLVALAFFIWVYLISEGKAMHKISVLLMAAILGYWLISFIDYTGLLLDKYLNNKKNK